MADVRTMGPLFKRGLYGKVGMQSRPNTYLDTGGAENTVTRPVTGEGLLGHVARGSTTGLAALAWTPWHLRRLARAARLR